MTNFFASCKTLDELKKAYKAAAMKYHPDMGGDTATMQAVNAEYERLFPILKLAYNQTAAEPTHETADSFRSEFYTANGWKGHRYDIRMSTKDVSIAVRAYLKATYPDCKFSVTTHYASMCSEISVSLMSGPYEALRDGKTNTQVNEYYIERDTTLTDWSRAVMMDVNDCICSYRFSDCDGMIDYFNVNFYYGLGVGRWDKPYTVVAKQAKINPPKQAEAPNPKPSTVPAVRVTFNDSFEGIEVYFPDRPSAETREALKSSGWRWHGTKKCWYHRNSEETLQALRNILESPKQLDTATA